MLKKKKYAKNQLDDQGPDWGDLKPVEGEVPPVLKKTEKVSMTQHIFCSHHNDNTFHSNRFQKKRAKSRKSSALFFSRFFGNVVQKLVRSQLYCCSSIHKYTTVVQIVI